jgi:hypothetical protein
MEKNFISGNLRFLMPEFEEFLHDPANSMVLEQANWIHGLLTQIFFSADNAWDGTNCLSVTNMAIGEFT